MPDVGLLSARCYCGASRLEANDPLTVAYCHCADCKRWTGGPVGAFAAFAPDDLTIAPAWCLPVSLVEGVERWNCPKCHSPLAARFAYLPDQIYVPLGLFEDAEKLPPQIHCHGDSQISWLHLTDDLPRTGGSGRAALNASKPND